MELIMALVLFIGLIASWLMLPGSTTTTRSEPIATTTAHTGSATASQGA